MIPRLFIICVVLMVVGCNDSFVDSMDMKLSSLISRQQQEILGDPEAVDPSPVPVVDKRKIDAGDMYDLTPPTTNPPADQLPVEADPKAGESTLGEAEQKLYLDETDQAIEMDMSEALAYAIANSRVYRSRKEDLYLAAIDLLSEHHLWGPRFFDEYSATVTGVPESGDHTHTLRLLNELGVTQRLPYGGEVSVSALINYVEHLRKKSDDVDILASEGQGAALVLSGSLPLLRGAGMAARENYIRAERGLVYQVRDFERFRRTFMVGIATDYYDLLLQEATIRNLVVQVENLTQIAQRIEALADSGRMPYIEVQRAQQEALFASNNLIIARERLALSFDRFKIQVGMDPIQPLKIKPVEVVIPSPILEPTEAIKTAHRFRLDLQTAKDNIADAERRLEIAKNELLGDLDLFATVTINADTSKENSGFNLRLDEGVYTAGVTGDLPLDREIERYNYRRAIIGLERTERDYTLLRDEISLAVRDAVRGIQQAKISYDIQELNVQLAERRQLGVQLRSRTLPVEEQVNAQERLLNAVNRRDQAMRDIRVSVLQYLLQTGQMRITGAGDWMPPAKLQPIVLEQAPLNGGGEDKDDSVRPEVEFVEPES